MDKYEYEDKFLEEVKCTSEFKVKEEIIVPEVTSDSESTLSDNEKVPDIELNECTVCCKYRSMFIILKNHECELEPTGQCVFCSELSHWIDIFKHHKEIHELENNDSSGDSTASDREVSEGTCKVCVKYEFMIPLLKSHVCNISGKQKCQNCVEVVHWTACFKEHLRTHEIKDMAGNKKEKYSETKNFQNTLCINDIVIDSKCSICLKYEAKLIILEEGHLCEKKLDTKCEKCDEIFQLHECFQKHKSTHNKEDEVKREIEFLNSGNKFDCGICLKLNSIVRNLVKNHKCRDVRSCSVCRETSYWLSCVKNHKRSELKSHGHGNTSHEKPEILKALRQQNCGVCSKYQLALSNLNDHTCSRQKGKHKCEYCLEMSFWSQSLKRHANTHLPDSLPCKFPSL